MSRVKTFDSTGAPTGGRLYSGDLNSLQDHYADLSNFLQAIATGSLVIGDNTIQLTKYGAAEARLSSSVRFDGIARALGGLWAGQSADPTVITAGSRPYGLAIFNTAKNRLEINVGSDAAPNWVSAARGLQDADVAAGAAIAYSKLSLAGTITNADISTGAAIAKSKLAALGIVDADVAAGAAIAKSKLAALSIIDADIAAGAAIAKSKLAPLNIGNTDVAVAAGIAVSKLAAGTDGQALVTSGGAVVWGSLGGVYPGSYPVTTNDLSNGAVTSLKIADSTIVDADISSAAAIGYGKLNLANAITNNDISGTAAIAKTKLAALNIADADIAAGAAISKSKLAALNIANADVVAGAAIALSKIEAVSPSGTAFPGSPYDGQRYTWVATSGGGVMWEMRYRSGAAWWEFVGGTALYFLRDARNYTNVAATWNDAFVSTTAPFAGTFDVEFGAVMESSGNQGQVGVSIGGAAPDDAFTNVSTVIETSIVAGMETASRCIRITATSGQTIKLQYRSKSGGDMWCSRTWLKLTPVHT